MTNKQKIKEAAKLLQEVKESEKLTFDEQKSYALLLETALYLQKVQAIKSQPNTTNFESGAIIKP